MKTLALLAAYQACWWGSVCGAAAGMPWIGPCLALALAALVLNFSDDFLADALLIGAAAVLGWMLDSALLQLGILHFPETARFGPGSPVWMVGLWGAFGLTLRPLCGFLRGRPWLAAFFGLVGGPLAYWAGVRLGALSVGHGLAGYAAVAAEYTLGLVILERMWNKVGGLGPRQLAEAEADAMAGKGAHA